MHDMKICIAQTRPILGDISANLEAHKRFIDLALSLKTEAIFFPELSLTGYEPKLAKKIKQSLLTLPNSYFQLKPIPIIKKCN